MRRLAQDLFSKGLLPSRSLRDTLRRIDFRIEMAAAAAQASSAALDDIARLSRFQTIGIAKGLRNGSIRDYRPTPASTPRRGSDDSPT